MTTPAEFLARFNVPCFYHFTDTRNLEGIRTRGGIYPWRQIASQAPAPGGNDWSHEADSLKGLDLYVHLCLFNEHPMEYRARKDGRILQSRFLRIDKRVLFVEGVLFCPDVSNKAGVRPLSIADAVAGMDFEVVYEKTDWRNPVIKGRRVTAKKYELLVPGLIPLDLISGL